jgi:PST family polysaccharide transporter
MRRDKNKSLGKVARRGVAWSFVREGVTEVILFPTSMVMARLLTPAEFGIAVAATFFLALSGRLSGLGFNAAIVRAKVVEPVHLSTVFTIGLALGVLKFAALTAAAPLIAAFYNVPETGQVIPVAALSFLIAPLGAVQAALLTRNMKYRQGAFIDWAHVLTRAVVTIVTAWYGFSYMSLVYGSLASSVVQTALRIALVRWRPSLRVSLSALREILPFGFGVHAKKTLDYAALNVDNLIVGRLLGMTALGFYDKAFSTMDRILSRFNQAGPNVTFRIFSIIHDQPERFGRAYAKVVMASSLMAFPIFAIAMATAEPLMIVLFGGQWQPAAAPFQVLCIVGCFRVLNSYASSALQAAGWIWSEVSRQGAYIALIVVNLYIFQSLGVLGAALGVLIASSIMTIAMHLLLKRAATLAWSDILRPQLPGIVCGLIGGATVVLVASTMQIVAPGASVFVRLVAQVGAAGLACAAFVLFMPYPALRSLVCETADLLPQAMRQTRWVRAYLHTHEAAQS